MLALFASASINGRIYFEFQELIIIGKVRYGYTQWQPKKIYNGRFKIEATGESNLGK